MTDTVQATPTLEPGGGSPARGGAGLSGKLLPELKQIAGGLGIRGVSGMKKAQLVEAIRAAQGSSDGAGQAAAPERTAAAGDQGPGNGSRSDRRSSRRSSAPVDEDTSSVPASASASAPAPTTAPTAASTAASTPTSTPPSEPSGDGTAEQRSEERPATVAGGEERSEGGAQGREGGTEAREGRPSRDQRRSSRDKQPDQQRDQSRDQQRDQQDREDQRQDQRQDQGTDQGAQSRQDRDDEDGSNRRRRRRGRDRDRAPAQQQQQQQQQPAYRERRQQDDVDIAEDDVLVPVAGIVDILENYAFVRTSGYLPGPDDVYVSLSMVRKYSLRKGDAVTGAVRQPREGERKEKFNPLVRLETVNGGDVEAARHRVDFNKLTPLYAHERLRLETEATNLIGRVIDIAAPIGKGQRGLIVSPAKAGKTMIMQSIANSITTNNPECHLMVVLVDERPEEVTDFQRSVKGEVISSTFDRPAGDHTIVAELAIERAKRLVELGHDVVVLLDGITRLGRAYNLAAPASGRILSGGVDSAALYPPKKFFGAARNIEDGGSLTILATALIESGSKMDEVIFEEFKGTGNMEIRLRRDFADKRLFPAIDAVQSGTRREELLMSKEELAIVWKLRRVLSGLEGQQALELLLERLKKTHSNVEFLLQVQKTTPEPAARNERGPRD